MVRTFRFSRYGRWSSLHGKSYFDESASLERVSVLGSSLNTSYLLGDLNPTLVRRRRAPDPITLGDATVVLIHTYGKGGL
ncbi:hypothetical protein CEXT_145261 [Caerostris extrusa]|uniref:Uncharacterized protein n=1 Tax=Caerostris extrusa TaxID=172846 RepID=A0AAV4PT95_CAEEX|nr:hypothetical protein CEXT_145261 [Caerostris extrusa]